MNILIIGAGGKSGKLIVERAVAAGHSVTAFVHDAATYSAPPGVRVASGDAKSLDALAAAMPGQAVVIDAVGGKTPYLKTDLEQSIARSVIAAMQQHNVKRLIVISALGVGDSREQSPLLYDYLLRPTFLRGSTADKNAMESEVKASGLDYILVRPAMLTDAPATGSIKVITGHDKAHKITRGDVAQFIIDHVSGNAYLNEAVTIANS